MVLESRLHARDALAILLQLGLSFVYFVDFAFKVMSHCEVMFTPANNYTVCVSSFDLHFLKFRCLARSLLWLP